jgi:hypothetical protein
LLVDVSGNAGLLVRTTLLVIARESGRSSNHDFGRDAQLFLLLLRILDCPLSRAMTNEGS